jgi:hypothetical protein
MKSLTLSATELAFSYDWAFDGGELPGAPLPQSLQLVLKGGEKIDAVITDCTDEGGIVRATAVFPEPVNLAEAHYVLFGTPDFGQVAGGGIKSGIILPLTPPDFPDEGPPEALPDDDLRGLEIHRLPE